MLGMSTGTRSPSWFTGAINMKSRRMKGTFIKFPDLDEVKWEEVSAVTADDGLLTCYNGTPGDKKLYFLPKRGSYELQVQTS